MKTPDQNASDGITASRVEAYQRGELDSNAIVSLGQDIYEAGVLPKLPPRFFLLTEHLKRNNLMHTHGRKLH